MGKRLTTDQFIERATTKHGDRYDYSLVEYTNANSKVDITCRTHGVFKQEPYRHVKGQGCISCQYDNKRTGVKQFIKSAMLIHGDRYSYSDVVYVNTDSKVTIKCTVHGEFEQAPDSHLRGRGCPHCGGTLQSNTERFTKRALRIHNGLYSYDNVTYVDVFEKVSITCHVHGDFMQSPTGHLNKGAGCPLCCNNKQSNTVDFIEKAKLVHGDKYSYDQVEYVNLKSKVVISCHTHGEFSQLPSNHVHHKQGCPSCSVGGFDHSKIAYLYFLISECGGFIKIGITCDTKRRFRELKLKTPFDFNPVEIFRMGGQYAEIIEQSFHSLGISAGFKDFSGATEWFLHDGELLDIARTIFSYTARAPKAERRLNRKYCTP